MAGSGGEDFLEILKIQKQLQYPQRLSFYGQPPPVEISMEEFERFALDRLQGGFIFVWCLPMDDLPNHSLLPSATIQPLLQPSRLPTVLKALESAMLRNRSADETKRLLKDALATYMPFNATLAFKQGVALDAERRKDYLSHFILRLAYSRRYFLYRRMSC